MCESCIEDGTIARWLWEVVEEFNDRWESAQFEGGHIVLADCNVQDSHIQFCLDHPVKDNESGDWRALLRWMLTIPQEDRGAWVP